MGEERARTFFALPLAEELGAAVHALVQRNLGAGAAERDFRLPRPEGLHLTLLFLGEIERKRLPRLWSDVLVELQGASSPRLRITETGAFPDHRRARVLWLGLVEEQGAKLARIHDGILAAAERSGFDTHEERGRPFHPHITIARPRSRRSRVPEGFYALRPDFEWLASELVLFESVAAGKPGAPPIYRALETLSFAP